MEAADERLSNAGLLECVPFCNSCAQAPKPHLAKKIRSSIELFKQPEINEAPGFWRFHVKTDAAHICGRQWQVIDRINRQRSFTCKRACEAAQLTRQAAQVLRDFRE